MSEWKRLYDAWKSGKGPKPLPQRKFYSAPRKPAKEPKPLIVDPIGAHTARREHVMVRSERDKLLQLLEEERTRNDFLASVRAGMSRTPKIIRTEKKSGLREMAAVIMGSDWHVEETVPLVKAGGRNEYNLEIADASVRKFFTSAIDLVEHHRASGRIVIRDMVCAFSGDLMTGYIHRELIESNAMSPTMTVRWLLPRLQDGIHTLLDRLQLNRLSIPWSYGNHGRTTEKKQISTGAENSYEYLLGTLLELSFKDDKRVQFDTNPTPHQFTQVYDFTQHWHHGDSLNYQGGVGGLGIPLLKAVPQWDSERFAHWHYIGHWHQLRDFGRALINGSLIGHGPYSREIRAGFELPQQLFHLIDSKRGKCHVTPLWIRDEPKRQAA